MAIDSDDLNRIREALEGTDSVDSRRITVRAGEDDTIVLTGPVATFEEASAAGLVVEEHTDAHVRNELHVDPNVREDNTDLERVGDQTARDADENRDELSGSAFGEDGENDGDSGGIVTDVQESLDENLPWTPPDEPVMVPTISEERGQAEQGLDDSDPDEDGPLDAKARAGERASLDDLTAQELARAAHPRSTDDRDRD